MAFRFVLICVTLAYANAGLLGAPAISAFAAAPTIAYGAPTYQVAPTLAYSAAPAISTYAAAPAISYSTPALTSQSSNIYRSFGNLGQVSTYSKTIDTPFSSVRKSDVRVSNPGLQIAVSPAYAAHAYAAPALHYSSPAIAHAAPLGVAYSAAPAVTHISYKSGYTNYAW
ncbi:hypothetical protein NQ314_017181 [Rhamnusium bicolor]|uniref:Uncharacterized protein n=1 Tax=Rhamnusium bicolor TaxID=1586634 RepID=A0AAV8WU02_9CUCU|nr:hypothetical protein NQ314_017181 [Rhamnusium bicolor]